MEDRRKEFKNKYWLQGRLLLTRITEGWSEQEKKSVDEVEKRIAFVDFKDFDEGRGRKFVYMFKTPEKCLKAIDKHNKKLSKK